MATIESVCNQALDVIGYPRHIGNIYDGTKAAIIALNAWGQTRDSALAMRNPEWARKDGVLSLSKSAPNIVNGTASYPGAWSTAYPPIPWLYEYLWPADCVRPLQIKSTPANVPIWRPRPNQQRWLIDTNAMTVLTNEADAILTYIFAVLDPNIWYQDFTDQMVAEMAKVFSVELGKEKASVQPNNPG